MKIEDIVKNKTELINIKKGALKHSDNVINHSIKDFSDVSKVELKEVEESSNVSIIANTYYWLDSHGDVHLKGCFTKSIKESLPANKIFHFDNHNHSFASKVGNVKDVKEVSILWNDLGVSKEGFTTCLIGETELIEDYNCQVYKAYLNKEITQHSVGMQYVTINLAVNNPANIEEYKLWNNIFPLLGNQQTALDNGYFWAVSEAKLKEYSCVLWNGSNSLTPTISVVENIEPSEDTHKEDIEPSNDTLEDQRKQFFINLSKK
jgi:hypothetical protein